MNCQYGTRIYKGFVSAADAYTVGQRKKRQEMLKRCEWCGEDPLYVSYHDDEWGVPVHDDQHLFEMLILEGAQAGLSWVTILKKRENYQKAFHNFDYTRIVSYTARDITRLLGNPGIVRNRLKIESTIKNARAAMSITEEFGSLDTFLWQFVEGIPLQNKWQAVSEIPPMTELSDAMSKDLKRRGFNFVGSTICYAFMQAVGMVNDHIISCYRYPEIIKAAQPARAIGNGDQ